VKHRSTRERLEAAMRVRTAADRLKRLQRKLRRASDESYRRAMINAFYDGLRTDKRIAKGEL
jgi:hypothetical protein